MTRTKTVVIVDSAGGTDDEVYSNKDLAQNGYHQNPQPVIKNKDDLDGPDKEIFLIKLPKELVKYQKEHKNLKINLKDVKDGKTFKINEIEYEGILSKSKVSFNCLCKKEDTYQAVSNFKYMIHVRQTIEIPEVNPPQVEKNIVQVPKSIENYLLNKEKLKQKHKTKKSKSLKRQLENEFGQIDKSFEKKLKK